ncbi:hypothetical protein HMPREF0880_03949 [Yokenella regensburgei ATCC 43003]|nr:hypothetical protein HMPREF0880_03949 [Yokenella regensburgei ATCC 43003]
METAFTLKERTKLATCPKSSGFIFQRMRFSGADDGLGFRE